MSRDVEVALALALQAAATARLRLAGVDCPPDLGAALLEAARPFLAPVEPPKAIPIFAEMPAALPPQPMPVNAVPRFQLPVPPAPGWAAATISRPEAARAAEASALDAHYLERLDCLGSGTPRSLASTPVLITSSLYDSPGERRKAWHASPPPCHA